MNRSAKSISFILLLSGVLPACEPGSPMTCYVFRDIKAHALPHVLASLEKIENEDQAAEQCESRREEDDLRGQSTSSEDKVGEGRFSSRSFNPTGSRQFTPNDKASRSRTIRDGYPELANLLRAGAVHMKAWHDFMEADDKPQKKRRRSGPACEDAAGDGSSPGLLAMVAEGYLSGGEQLNRGQQRILARRMAPLKPIFDSYVMVDPLVRDTLEFCALAKQLQTETKLKTQKSKDERAESLQKLFVIRARMIGTLTQFAATINGAGEAEALACGDRQPIGEIPQCESGSASPGARVRKANQGVGVKQVPSAAPPVAAPAGAPKSNKAGGAR